MALGSTQPLTEMSTNISRGLRISKKFQAQCCYLILFLIVGAHLLTLSFSISVKHTHGQDSTIGIATWYRLDGLGIESCRSQDFLHLSRLALGPSQPPTPWVLGRSWGLSCRGVALPTHPHLAQRLKKEQLYLYPPSVPSWQVMGWSLPLPFETYFIDCYLFLNHRKFKTDVMYKQDMKKHTGDRQHVPSFYAMFWEKKNTTPKSYSVLLCSQNSILQASGQKCKWYEAIQKRRWYKPLESVEM